MFANYVATPFVALSLVFLYMAWEVDSDYAIWILPFVLLSAAVYIFSPQINWWWYSRHPKDLSPGLRAMMERSGLKMVSLERLTLGVCCLYIAESRGGSTGT